MVLFIILIVLFAFSGQVSKSWPGPVEQTFTYGQKFGAEPVSVPGLICTQFGVQCHVLHLGASSCLHKSSQWPLDPERLCCPAFEPHLLVYRDCVLKSETELPPSHLALIRMALIRKLIWYTKLILIQLNRTAHKHYI